jgi:hypothetical protein
LKVRPLLNVPCSSREAHRSYAPIGGGLGFAARALALDSNLCRRACFGA